MPDSFDLRSLLRLPSTVLPDGERLGRRMAALYRCWNIHGIDLARLAECLMGPNGGAGQPIGRACLEAAELVAAWGGHPYHSAAHHAEVATNAFVLAEITKLAEPRRVLLLTAAFAHDYLYQPAQPRFCAEQASAAAMDAIASRCGVAATDRLDLHRLILATELGFRRALSGVPPVQPLPEPLRVVLTEPELRALASILSDADLLSSAGLTVRWSCIQNKRLERELQRRIPPSEDLAFLDNFVGSGFLTAAGRCFDVNLTRIRAHHRMSVSAQAETDPSATR